MLTIYKLYKIHFYKVNYSEIKKSLFIILYFLNSIVYYTLS